MSGLFQIEFSGVALSCFTLSRFAVSGVSLIKPEDSFNPSLKDILYSVL